MIASPFRYPVSIFQYLMKETFISEYSEHSGFWADNALNITDRINSVKCLCLESDTLISGQDFSFNL